jgi:predicted phage terminase large subunit-like protein
MIHRLKSSKTLIMAGRSLGKSFLLTTSYTLTLILRDPDIAIAIVTNTQALSKKFVSDLKAQIERKNGIIMEIFGDIKDPTEWNKLEFKVLRSVDRIESTVTACSINAPGQIVGGHYDVILLDDITDTKSSMTKYLRDKAEEQLYNQVLPAMHPQSKYRYTHIIGTHYHWDDIYVRLEEKGSYKTLKVKSILEKEDEEGNKIEYCCWEGASPATVEDIFLTRQNNPLAFKQQYQQIVEKGDGGIFKREWIKSFDKILHSEGSVFVLYPDEEGEKKKEKVRVAMGVDPAISKKDTADNFVIAVIGMGEETGHIYLLDLFRGKLSFNEQMNTITRMAEKWPMTEGIFIEAVAYQAALYQEMARTTKLPVQKVPALKDKETRFRIFSAQWENGKVFLYDKTPHLDELVTEALSFPDAEHDDMIDAFCIAWEGIPKRKTLASQGITVKDFGF